MMKRNVLARKILCGLLAAGVVGACGSAFAANGIEAKPGEDIDGNAISSDGKFDEVSYGLKAQGVFTKVKDKDTNIITITKEKSKLSLTTENIDINASMDGVSGKQLASLIIGDNQTNNVTIVGKTRGVYLDKGSTAIIKGNAVKIISTGSASNAAAILVDNKFKSPEMTELAELEIYGKQIEIEAVKNAIQAKGQSGNGLKGSNVILGNNDTENIVIKG